MGKKQPAKKQYRDHLESVRIEGDVVDAVRKNKKKTKMPVGAFFAMAAMEKLKSQTKGKKEQTESALEDDMYYIK
jgi:hypothetical protein